VSDRIRNAEFVSLNSVRGIALHAAVEYALWCVRNLETQDGTSTSWFDGIPEARALFEAKLNPRQEQSPAVRSVFAHYLPNLSFLDRVWLERQIPRLFAGLGPAWDTYLLHGQLHGAVAPLLAPCYLQAALEAGSPRSQEDAAELERRLPEHLLLLHAYLGEKMPRMEEILTAFFEHAPARQRAHLIGFAGWHADEAKNLPLEALARIMDLIERRVSAVAGSSAMKAKEELSEWTSLCLGSAFPDDWVLRIARMAVPAWSASDGGMSVGERLAKIAEKDLEGALEILQLVSTKDLEPFGIHDWNEAAEMILSRSVAVGGRLREIAIDVINSFTERGYSQFEGLLPR
jgi:hypothetical protein